ncbi:MULTISPECIES: cation:dicarboxylate symporter family transporter [unclassified Arthrobacter]|uniref:cation:dicarboxylate symporter family transporter n=1 Tax=unclassified Arthrobacter TaxID=235627 RepID=UPI00159E2195|nr:MULTISPECIES: cation:dicarboxylase symporter family transporter [unclassified Arthrobacter]MCQ9164316.1 cation:dicarboxylase symporter family transporter [Arthrobacter sp. STN4]NVM99495.1 cation:dicarboxylase symporter family transporter [Arthrobacter sp. SDTb3-6]
MSSQRGGTAAMAKPARRKMDKTHWLYVAVIAAVVLGAAIGLMAPEVGKSLKPLGTMFIALIKMIIAPIIFCTIVLGVGSIAKAATVGKVGGLALVYFMVMSTVALAIGLVVGNIVHPGAGLHLQPYKSAAASGDSETVKFLLDMIPGDIPVLPTLVLALLVGFALQSMGKAGEPVLNAVKNIQKVVFKLMMMIMWVAPVGAFGAIAAVVGATGWAAIGSMAILMGAFYLTCALFIVVILGSILRVVTGLNIFALMRYLAREYLLIFATSSSESALPRLIAKMEHVGVSKPVVGITVPTGYSFNLDGTAIYLTMSSIFISTAMGMPMNLGEQIGLLVFMVIASKGAAGVTGAGLATLAAGLQAHKPILLDGMGVIVGIDKFMSECRALTNFTGNAVAALLVGKWTRELDIDQARAVLSGRRPFDELSLEADGHAVEADAPLEDERVPAGV